MKNVKREKTIKCECCGEVIVKTRKWKRFCSSHCRFKAWQKIHRKKAK